MSKILAGAFKFTMTLQGELNNVGSEDLAKAVLLQQVQTSVMVGQALKAVTIQCEPVAPRM